LELLTGTIKRLKKSFSTQKEFSTAFFTLASFCSKNEYMGDCYQNEALDILVHAYLNSSELKVEIFKKITKC
jgi:hypothetical protein